jgi:hypothetical protein
VFALVWIFKGETQSYFRYVFFAFDHGIHEIGHWVTRPFGLWISIPAGTIFQIALPTVAAVALWRHRDMYGVLAIPIWHGFTFANISYYAGSAAYSDLELWTPHFFTLYHDWVWMLSKVNKLGWAGPIESLFYVLAVTAALLSVAGQAWGIYKIFQAQKLS